MYGFRIYLWYFDLVCRWALGIVGRTEGRIFHMPLDNSRLRLRQRYYLDTCVTALSFFSVLLPSFRTYFFSLAEFNCNNNCKSGFCLARRRAEQPLTPHLRSLTL